MIREDRIKLNERFIKVFKQLQSKGDIVLNNRNGKGMGDLAERILGNKAYGHIIRSFLKEDRSIDYHQAKILCEHYGISEQYMLKGIGEPFEVDEYYPELVDEIFHEGQQIRSNITYTTVQAFAGSGESAVDTRPEKNLQFSIPGVGGSDLVAFHIEGRSMEPEIQDGDMIICNEIQSLKNIKNNDIYAVKHDGSVWVKYLQIIPEGNSIKKLKLISTNVLEFDPFMIELNETTRIYKVMRKVSNV